MSLVPAGLPSTMPMVWWGDTQPPPELCGSTSLKQLLQSGSTSPASLYHPTTSCRHARPAPGPTCPGAPTTRWPIPYRDASSVQAVLWKKKKTSTLLTTRKLNAFELLKPRDCSAHLSSPFAWSAWLGQVVLAVCRELLFRLGCLPLGGALVVHVIGCFPLLCF